MGHKFWAAWQKPVIDRHLFAVTSKAAFASQPLICRGFHYGGGRLTGAGTGEPKQAWLLELRPMVHTHSRERSVSTPSAELAFRSASSWSTGMKWYSSRKTLSGGVHRAAHLGSCSEPCCPASSWCSLAPGLTVQVGQNWHTSVFCINCAPCGPEILTTNPQEYVSKFTPSVGNWTQYINRWLSFESWISLISGWPTSLCLERQVV